MGVGPGAYFVGLVALTAIPTMVVFLFIALWQWLGRNKKLGVIACVLIPIASMLIQAAVLYVWPDFARASITTMVGLARVWGMPLAVVVLLTLAYQRVSISSEGS